jgi:hypothetical protein
MPISALESLVTALLSCWQIARFQETGTEFESHFYQASSVDRDFKRAAFVSFNATTHVLSLNLWPSNPVLATKRGDHERLLVQLGLGR